jgi:hypothetical protein
MAEPFKDRDFCARQARAIAESARLRSLRERRRGRLRVMGLASDEAGEAGPDEARRRRAKSGWEAGIRTRSKPVF